MSYPYLSEIESGSKRPSSRALLAIAEALGVPLSALMGSAESLASEEIATRADHAEPRAKRRAMPRREATADVAPLPRSEMMSTRARAHSRQPSHDLHELVRMLENLSPHDQELVAELIRRLSR